MGSLDIDGVINSLTPEQWDELQAADSVDPQGERRADMRLAFLVAQMWNMQPRGKDAKWVSLKDALGWFNYEMLGKSLTAPQKASPAEMSKVGRGMSSG